MSKMFFLIVSDLPNHSDLEAAAPRLVTNAFFKSYCETKTNFENGNFQQSFIFESNAW
jgi:hypothetical protein